MAENPPATIPEAPLVVDTVSEMHADHVDPQRQQVQQNVGVGLLPLALVIFLLLIFVAAAWTFLAAQGA